ncbi:MAG: hypothetical protein KBE16_06215 [Alphaproteobacteria bacterium]|nr:hypothetical protein [Alphaproteobacteria bacterium]
MRFNFKEITKLHSFEKNTLHFCHSQTVEASAAFEELISYKKDCEQAKEALKQITELKIHGNLTN